MRSKDILSLVTEICTLIFKVIIYGVTMITMVALGFNVAVVVLVGIVGSIWVMGHKNVMILYHLFKNRGKDR